MKLLYRFFYLASLFFSLNCFTMQSLYGQSHGIGTWNIVNLKYQLGGKWSSFGEAQLRSLQFYQQFHYYEYKAGLSYIVNEKMILSLAAGSYQTYKEGGNFMTPKNNDEFRLWPQVQLLQSIGRFKIEQRYRAELRFTSNGYRNRFRYRLGVNYSFGRKEGNSQPYQLYLNNEVFFTDGEPFFERNRMAMGFQYRIATGTSLLLGYLHQFDYHINDETGRDFIQLGYYLDIPSRKK
jgi:hypothetical protein